MLLYLMFQTLQEWELNNENKDGGAVYFHGWSLPKSK